MNSQDSKLDSHSGEPPVLDVQDLRVEYDGYVAVEHVSFSVHRGEIFGLLGPNGAGKTSTLSSIEGLIHPKTGTIKIAGVDISSDPLLAKAQMGVQLQASSFQQDLNIHDILELYAGLYGVPITDQQIKDIMVSMQLQNDTLKRTAQLSGGQQQRVALATATIHNPQLLLLDEPTTGLDPQSRRQLWSRIEAMRDSGRSILLTTHSMEEARSVCDRVAIIDHGRILVTGTPASLIEQYKDDPDVRAASRRGEVTLEDVFIGLTGKEVRK